MTKLLADTLSGDPSNNGPDDHGEGVHNCGDHCGEYSYLERAM